MPRLTILSPVAAVSITPHPRTGVNIVSATGDIGGSADVGISSNGYPHLVFYDPTNPVLQYATLDPTGTQQLLMIPPHLLVSMPPWHFPHSPAAGR